MSASERDPFAPTADPERYVRRAASERALAELERALAEGATRILLHGPPGIGKTLLVRLLATRATSFRLAEASYPALAPADLCDWVLREMGVDANGDPEERLLAQASRDHEHPLLLLIDDAHSLPAQTTSRLRALSDRAGGALRVLAVATDGEPAYVLDEALAPERDVRFDEPMSPTELADYVNARLSAAAVPAAARSRFDESALARLHRESEGLPGPLHHAATALLRGAPSPSAIEAAGPATSEGMELRVAEPTASPEEPAPLPAGGAAQGDLRRSRGLPLALALPVLGLGLWSLLASRDGEVAGPPAASKAAARAPAREAPRQVMAPSSGQGPAPGSPAPAEATDPGPAALSAEPAFAEPALRVQLNATPWADIEVDGTPLGVTPLADIEIEPGRHRFRARMPDGRILQRDVILSPELRHLFFE